MYTHVQGSIIHNGQDMESVHIPTNGGLDDDSGVHTQAEALSHDEKHYAFTGGEHAKENSIQREKCDVSALVRRAGTKNKKGTRRVWN